MLTNVLITIAIVVDFIFIILHIILLIEKNKKGRYYFSFIHIINHTIFILGIASYLFGSSVVILSKSLLIYLAGNLVIMLAVVWREGYTKALKLDIISTILFCLLSVVFHLIGWHAYSIILYFGYYLSAFLTERDDLFPEK